LFVDVKNLSQVETFLARSPNTPPPRHTHTTRLPWKGPERESVTRSVEAPDLATGGISLLMRKASLSAKDSDTSGTRQAMFFAVSRLAVFDG
jgi:hypothetical protein